MRNCSVKLCPFCLFFREEFVNLSNDEKSKRHNALGGAVPQYQKARRIPLIAARERLSARGTNPYFSYHSNSKTTPPAGSGCV